MRIDASLFGSQPHLANQRPTPAELARRVFQTKHNLHLVPGAIQWLEDLVDEFNLEDEGEGAIVTTFETLVKGVQGTGSGLG